MADVTRTFVAVALPEALTPRLARLRDELSASLEGARWANARPHHVTLAFLGDVAHADLAALCQGVQRATEDLAAFELRLEGLGVFPNPARPSVLWVGVAGSGLESLSALQARVAEAARHAGYPPDTKPFHPHVTLGRFETRGGRRGRGGPPAAPPRLEPILARYRGWSTGPFAVDEAIVFSSTLAREGPEHAPLARASLGRSNPPGRA